MTAFPGQWCIPGGWEHPCFRSIHLQSSPAHDTQQGGWHRWSLAAAHLLGTPFQPCSSHCHCRQTTATNIFPIPFATISSCGHSSQLLHSGRAILDCAVNPLIRQVQANPEHSCSSSWQGRPRQDLRPQAVGPEPHLAVLCPSIQLHLHPARSASTPQL